MFLTLRKMQDICSRLELDHLHPALEGSQLDRQRALEAIDAFRARRASFYKNPHSIGAAELQQVYENIETRIKRFNFVLAVKERLQNTPSLEHVVMDHNVWTCGMTDRSTIGDGESLDAVTKVQFQNGIEAEECVLEVGTGFHLLFNPIIGIQRRSSAKMTERVDSHVYNHRGHPIIIVGWTVSCDSKNGKSFCVTGGGLLKDYLTIKILSPKIVFDFGPPCLWRCRVIFVNKYLYNFSNLPLD